jgi:hypothetical protein
VYRVILDGSYRRSEVDGKRKFGKTSESITQDLTLDVDYRPLTGTSIFFRVNKRYGTTISVQQQGQDFVEVTTNSEFTEIEIGGSANYTLRMGLNLSMRLRRVQNWTSFDVRNNYFVGDLTITHRF